MLRNAIDHFQLDSVELWLYDPQKTLAELLPDSYLTLPELHLFSNINRLEKLYGKQSGVRLVTTGDGHPLPVFDGGLFTI